MKIFIGVTRHPDKVKRELYPKYGQDGTLTEVGPFASRIEALNWLALLKSRISNVEEVIPYSDRGKDDLWFGFTFEQQK